MAPQSKRPLDKYVRRRRAHASVSACAAETLVSALGMPAPAGLLGLVLAVLAWLDGGTVHGPWTTWPSPSATRPPRAASTRPTSASTRSRRARTTAAS